MLPLPADDLAPPPGLDGSSVGIDARKAAAQWLADQSGRPVGAEVLATATTLPAGDEGLGNLLGLLLDADAAALQQMRRELQDAAQDDGHAKLINEAALAALVRADGFKVAWDWTATWSPTLGRIALLRGLENMPADDLSRERMNEAFDVLVEQLPEPPSDHIETPRARFVRVFIPGSGTLTLPEVEVMSKGLNVALGKAASQSSEGWGGTAVKAVDGDTNGVFSAGTSTHTLEGHDTPWWEVDLGQAYPIDTVKVWNRTDGDYGSRLNNFTVELLDANRNAVWTKANIARPRPMVSLEPARPGVSPITGSALGVLASVAGREADAMAILDLWASCSDEQLRWDAVLAIDTLPEALKTNLHPTNRLVRQVIHTVKDQMAYDVKSFEVPVGAPVEIVLVNVDAMPHNLVLVGRGKLRKVGRASDAQGMGGDAAARDYVPDMPDDILEVLGLIMEDEQGVLRFTAPDKPGRYPYVCTYPQHWQMMNGVLKVERP